MPRSILAGATLSCALLVPGLACAWQTNVSATPPASRPLAVTVDGAGDVLAVGRVDAVGGDDGIVVKLGGLDGGERWQRTVAGSGAVVDQLEAVAHDAANAVIAGGQATNLETNGDALVVKYDANGTQAWRIDVDGGANGEDDALAVALDGADVVAVGRGTPLGRVTAQFTVLKRAGSDGGSVWRTDLTGAPGTGRALVVAGGDVVAAGDVAGHIVVTKLAATDGSTAWRTDVAGDPVAADLGRAVAVGGGHVVVAGRMVTTAGGQDFAVVALDAATGAEAWRYVVDGSATGAADLDDAFGVAVDAAGEVIAVGRVSDAVSDADLVVAKLAGASGAELWRTTVKGGNNNDDDAQAVALDAAGDALVVGSVRNAGRGRDLFLGKFAGATGSEQWRLEVNGTESAGDFGSAVAVNAAGDAIATGRLRNGAAGDGFTVVKRTGENGGDFPCANGEQDAGEACDDGNVVAGDGCRADCTIEVCGDGIRDPNEQCDDGNLLEGDCCSATCTTDADGSTCDDGNACTLNDACTGGACVPADVVACVPASPCHDAACDPADGSCSSTPKPNGALCDDGNACTTPDRCLDTVCTGGSARRCDDGDVCTLDRCDASVGCVWDPRSGFDGVTCVLARQEIRISCGPDVPRPIQATLDRIGRLLARGATAQRPGRARSALARAVKTMKRGLRLTDKQRRQNRVTFACAAGITGTLNDLVSSATGLRDKLAAGS
jgi:cysteine-rich repeat protein